MKKYFAIALAALAVAGCHNKENDEPVAAGQICVEPLIKEGHNPVSCCHDPQVRRTIYDQCTHPSG